MRRTFLFVSILALGCDLYQIDPPVSIDLPNLHPYYTQPKPEIEYRIRGAFLIDMEAQLLNNQHQWVTVPALSLRLIEQQGKIVWSEPLENTTYRLVFRAVASRGGLQKVLDTAIKEVTFDVVLQPMLVHTVSLVPGSVIKSGSVPQSAQFKIKGWGIRPGARLLLLDTSFSVIFFSPPYDVYLRYFPILGSAVHVFGLGVRTADLGAGLEEWTYQVNFNCYDPPYALNGVQEFAVGEIIYWMVEGVPKQDPYHLLGMNQVYPNPFPHLPTSWPNFIWP